MNYQTLLNEKIAQKETLKKEIKLLKELVDIENKTHSVVPMTIKEPVHLPITDYVYTQAQLVNIASRDIRKMLNNYICEIKYVKQDGSTRVFNTASMCSEYTTELFNLHPNGNEFKPDNNDNCIFIIEKTSCDFAMKKLFKDKITQLTILR